MKSIHSENDLKEIIDRIQKDGFETTMEWWNNPRREFNIIKSIKEALKWLSSGNYVVSLFEGGHGLSMKNEGGCWGYFEYGLLERMVKENYIYGEKDNFGYFRFGAITKKGYRKLGEE